MFQYLFSNNAGSTLAASITNTATTATFTSGGGALFPSPSSVSGQVFPLTLTSATSSTTFEIVWVTARTGDTITMLRGQEGTTALAFNAGDLAQMLVTAGSLNPAEAEIANVITAAGYAPSPGSNAQLLLSINTLRKLYSPSSLTANGWKKYPDPNSPTGYFIRQWVLATITTTAPTGLTVTLPIAFPNAILSATGIDNGVSGSNTAHSVGISTDASLSTVYVVTLTPPTNGLFVIEGY